MTTLLERRLEDALDIQGALKSQVEYWRHKHIYEYETLAIALRELPLNDTTLQAIAIICRVLKEQNPRFDAGVFMEWCLEDV